jgi:hypothetical protein
MALLKSELLDFFNGLRVENGNLTKHEKAKHEARERSKARHAEKLLKSKIIAYDFETTNIASGTPKLLYITAYGENFSVSNNLTTQDPELSLLYLLERRFLIPELNHTKFIAWNGNKYDIYFIVRALLRSEEWLMQPYLTSSKALRGLRVIKAYPRTDAEKKFSVEFLDGCDMTGLIGKKLSWLVETFAPDFPKLLMNFETESFDVNNPKHILYAERDSEALYHAMIKIQDIIFLLTDLPLKPTVGNLAINYFMKNIPPDVELKKASEKYTTILHGSLKRGGYCWLSRQYKGPVWKYDINQAYAAAMRDADLPSGDIIHAINYKQGRCGVYLAKFHRRKHTNVPFYYRDILTNKGMVNDGTFESTAWITSIEYEHLIKDGWIIKTVDGFYFRENFRMTEFVNNLEHLRSTDLKGPSGPLGTMVKALGNNAFGKTLERLWDNEFIIASKCPENSEYHPVIPDDLTYETADINKIYLFARIRESFHRKYHLPQIGIFITAYNRCFLREKAMVMEDNFIYADTDCLVFDKPATHLEIHKTRYGAWKQEADGTNAIYIGKKIYYHADTNDRKAKGLRTKKLTLDTYEKWFDGIVPYQEQLQRNNIQKFLEGKPMFVLMEKRSGTDTKNLKDVFIDKDRFFHPVKPK